MSSSITQLTPLLPGEVNGQYDVIPIVSVGEIAPNGSMGVTHKITVENLAYVIGSNINPEIIMDTVAAYLVGGTGIAIVYDDLNDLLTISNTYTPPVGLLKVQNPLSTTLQAVQDGNNTNSQLYLATDKTQVQGTLQITTANNQYLDAEDSSGNNRFTIGRDPSSQQVNVDFASNPTGSTSQVGAIRTYQDGTNLSEVVKFREDGQVTFTERVIVEADSLVPTQTSSVIQAGTTNANLVIAPNGTGALVASIPDATATGGNARGINAVDLQTSRTAATQVASGACSTITGGKSNRAIGAFSFIGGGQLNCVTNTGGVIGGGCCNTSSGYYSGVFTGQCNCALVTTAVVVGGRCNTASNYFNFLGAGRFNTVSATGASLVGGRQNTSSGAYAFIGGGVLNTNSGYTSAIPGGKQNNASNNYTGILAGRNNTVSNSDSAIIGGQNNNVSSVNSIIGGGVNNIVSGACSALLGGQGNTVSGRYGFIGAGGGNTVAGTKAVVVGGNSNSASGDYSTVTGGSSNAITGGFAFIGGGQGNSSSGGSAIAGGSSNCIQQSSLNGFIGGGGNNTISGQYKCYSVIAGGQRNQVLGAFSSVVGGFSNCVAGCYNAILGGNNNRVCGKSKSTGEQGNSAIINGYSNFVDSCASTISGGYNNIICGCITANTYGGGSNYIGAGACNTISGYSIYNSAILAGSCNRIGFGGTGCGDNVIAGGQSNNACGRYGGIFVGIGNTTRNTQNAVVAGTNNMASGDKSIVGGGQTNTASATYSGVVAGYANSSTGTYSGILAGCNNVTSGNFAIVGAGALNTASGSCSIVGSGERNQATNGWTAVLGGCSNCATGVFSMIGGGCGNYAASYGSTISGGAGNCVWNPSTGNYSLFSYQTVGGGLCNKAEANGSIIAGGLCNCVNAYAYWGSILGSGNYVGTSDGTSAIGAGNNVNSVFGSAVGARNTVSGYGSFILGHSGSATATSTVVLGAYGIANHQNQFTVGKYITYLTPYADGINIVSGGTFDLSLDGTGVTNLIIPGASTPTSAWHIRVDYVASITSITGTATGVSITDTKAQSQQIAVRKSSSGSLLNILSGSPVSDIPMEDPSMSSAQMTYSVGPSQNIKTTFTAPTFAGGGTVNIKVVAKFSITYIR